MLTICIITAARPNFIKVAPIIKAIGKINREENAGIACKLVYTGKADDPSLEYSLFQDLDIPRPDTYLGITATDLNEITSKMLSVFDHWLKDNPIDVLIVVDDLSSTMAAALVAKRCGIQLAHIVAGTRSFDLSMPKEINRLILNSLCDIHFTAGSNSTQNALRSSHYDKNNVYMVGNILMDTLRHNHSRFVRPTSLDHLQIRDHEYYLFTVNRHAIIDNKPLLQSIVDKLCSSGTPIIAPLRDKAAGVLQASSCTHSNLHIIPPQSYLEFGYLVSHAKAIITDSGNVAEEATFLNIPCITLNSYTEHIETVNQGTNVLIGEDPILLGRYLRGVENSKWKACTLPDRWDGRTAERIVRILLEKSCRRHTT